MISFLVSARAEMAALHPAAPHMAIICVVLALVWAWRKFHAKSFEALPKGFQALPAMVVAVLLTLMSTPEAPIAKSILDCVAAAFGDGLGAVGLHHFAKAISWVPYGNPPKPGSSRPPIDALLLVILALLVPSCGILGSQEVRTANDVARAMCALHYGEREGLSFDDAARTFCKDLRPWLDLVLRAKREGVSATVYINPAELYCEPPDAGSEAGD